MPVSAVRSTVRCVPVIKAARDGEEPSDITFKTKKFFSKKVDLSGEKRVIINLTDVRWDHGSASLNIRRKIFRSKNEMQKIPVLLERLGFDLESQEKIYALFGKGDVDIGVDTFISYIKKSLITVERVGYSGKNADDPKFYLMVNEPEGKGGNNIFYKGFSRKGTPRGITKIQRERKTVVKVSNAAQQLFAFLKSHKQIPSYCCRVIRHEGEVKVSQLGGFDLHHFDLNNLNQKQRYQFYMSIFEGLSQIHWFGVHRDVKPGNIVTAQDSKENYFAKFIDFDAMREQRGEGKGIGSVLYYCPMRFLSEIQGQAFPISDKDDIWAAMYSICEVESYWISPADRILSPEFVERFKDYHRSGHSWEERYKWIQEEIGKDEGHLFNRLKPDPAYPLDELVYETAFMDYPERRMSAQEVVMSFGKKEASDEAPQDSIEIVDSSMSLDSCSENSY